MKTITSYPADHRSRLARLNLGVLAAALPFALVPPHTTAGTADTFTTGGSLLTAASYGSGKLPGNTTDVSLTTSTAALSITAGALSMESISALGTKSYTVSNATSTATNSTLTLGNSAGFTNVNAGAGGTANDLIYLASSNTLTIAGTNSSSGSGTLGLVLASSGNFDVTGTATLAVSANISESGGPATLMIDGNTTKTVTLSGTNTFTGGLVAAGNEVDVSSDANLGAAGGSITINGGRLGFATNSITIDPTRNFFVGPNSTGSNTSGTLSIKGTITVGYAGAIQNVSGTTGDLVKQGGGTLQLGGSSTYSGSTFLNNGVTQLTTGANRLPTGTVVNIGQSASANTGTLDLAGFNQQVAGLVSVTGGSNITKNTVTSSAGSATLTLGGTGTYAYGDGSATNSGIITGTISLSKTNSGSQTLGDVNTYTGSTTVAGGTLVLNTNGSINNSQSVQVTSGALTLNNAAAISNTGTLSLTSGTTLNLDAAAGTSETIGSLVLDGVIEPAQTYTTTQLTALDPSITFADTAGETLTVAVPEPTTVLGGVLLIGAVGWTQRRRLRGCARA